MATPRYGPGEYGRVHPRYGLRRQITRRGEDKRRKGMARAYRRDEKQRIWIPHFALLTQTITSSGNPIAFMELPGEGTVKRITGSFAMLVTASNPVAGALLAGVGPNTLTSNLFNEYFDRPEGTYDDDVSQDWPLCVPVALPDANANTLRTWVWNFDQRGQRRYHNGWQMTFGYCLRASASTSVPMTLSCRVLVEY